MFFLYMVFERNFFLYIQTGEDSPRLVSNDGKQPVRAAGRAGRTETQKNPDSFVLSLLDAVALPHVQDGQNYRGAPRTPLFYIGKITGPNVYI